MHLACSTIVGPPTDGGWVYCSCGEYGARWRDPQAGLFEVASRDGGRAARVLGFHNLYLMLGSGETPFADIDWRTGWALVRSQTPESYLFVRRESPLVVIAPGESNDTFWVEWPGGAS